MSDKKFTLVYCINTLAEGGGTARVLSTKASYFADTFGYDVHVLVSSQKGKPLCYNFSPRVKIHVMDDALEISNCSIPIIAFRRFIFNARKVYERKILEINPDFVTVLGPYFEDFIIPELCKRNNIASLREFHFSSEALKEIGKLYLKWLERIRYRILTWQTVNCFDNYDAIILLTQRDFNESIYKTRVEVIPNALEIDTVVPSTCDSKHVVSMGSFRSRVKRFDIQVRLWSEFVKTHPDWILNIYGDGVELPEIQKLIDKLDLRKNVILHGNTSDVVSVLSNSAFFIFTSCAEGLPMVLLEAMACGLPVVSFDCPCGPSDLIVNGHNGFLIEMDDVDSMLNKIRFLADNQEKIKEMGRNAKDTAIKYRTSVVADRWKSFYESFN